MNAHKFCPWHVKSIGSDRTISGWISTIDVDEEGDVVLPTGLDRSYYDDHPTLTLHHDDKRGIGRCRDYTAKARGVWAKYWINDDAEGEQAYHLIRNEIINGFSIEWNPRTLIASAPTQQEKMLYGDDCCRVFREWRLTGVAAVTKPMNGKCKIEGKSLERLHKLVGDKLVTPEVALALGVEVENPKPKVRVFMDGDAVVAVRGAA